MNNNKKEKINFQSYNCFLKLGHYGADNRLAIQLVSNEENADKGVSYGEPIAEVTFDIPEIALKHNEIIIKSCSENKGVLEVLKQSGFITDTKKEISTGFVTVQVVEKTSKLLELEKQLSASKLKI